MSLYYNQSPHKHELDEEVAVFHVVSNKFNKWDRSKWTKIPVTTSQCNDKQSKDTRHKTCRGKLQFGIVKFQNIRCLL